MNTETKQTVLILGGAGFIGSKLAERFFIAGYHVIVIDGIFEQTGGSRKNLQNILAYIQFIDSRIEDVVNLSDVISQSDIIIDSMAWMPHLLAIIDPRYDLSLNVESHLHLIGCLKEISDKKIIYLGSRSQYGNPDADEINEDTPMVPVDIHGIHKLTAETYYRVYSKFRKLNVISLRIANCFGANQPVYGNDLGLVGNFIKDILKDRDIEIYGVNRKRSLVYVEDLADLVLSLTKKNFNGFSAFNLSGQEIKVEDLVRILIEIIGKGSCRITEPPNEIRAIEMGNKKFVDEKLKRYLGGFTQTELSISLKDTVTYFMRQANWNEDE